MKTSWLSKLKLLLGVAIIMLVEAFLIMLYMVHREVKLEERYTAEARRTALETRYVLDGCQYSLDTNGYWANTLAHHPDCRMPLHWEHVLSDTSWWWKVREAGKRKDL